MVNFKSVIVLIGIIVVGVMILLGITFVVGNLNKPIIIEENQTFAIENITHGIKCLSIYNTETEENETSYLFYVYGVNVNKHVNTENYTVVTKVYDNEGNYNGGFSRNHGPMSLLFKDRDEMTHDKNLICELYSPNISFSKIVIEVYNSSDVVFNETYEFDPNNITNESKYYIDMSDNGMVEDTQTTNIIIEPSNPYHNVYPYYMYPTYSTKSSHSSSKVSSTSGGARGK